MGFHYTTLENPAKNEDNNSENKETQAKEQLQKEQEEKTTEQPQQDAELDVSSESFNPLKALYATDYRVTPKQPKIIYQNMAAFETALKKVGIWNLNKKPKTSEASGTTATKTKNPFLVKEETSQRRFLEHQLPVRTEPKVKSKHQRNLLRQMEQAEGPLKQLQEFVKAGKTIKVIIRKEHGIKGYAEGVLQMFDRHWNLLLVNVVECLEQRKYKYVENKLVCPPQPAQDCSDLLKQLGITLPQQSVKSLGRKRVEIKRHLPQLLLRGEHVVLVALKSTSSSKDLS